MWSFFDVDGCCRAGATVVDIDVVRQPLYKGETIDDLGLKHSIEPGDAWRSECNTERYSVPSSASDISGILQQRLQPVT